MYRNAEFEVMNVRSAICKAFNIQYCRACRQAMHGTVDIIEEKEHAVEFLLGNHTSIALKMYTNQDTS